MKRWMRAAGRTAMVSALPCLLLNSQSAHAEAPLSGGADPQHFDSKDYADECEWPSVTHLLNDGNEVCSGNYIGGKIVLTAGHCLTAGFRVSLDEPCSTDSDCPTQDEFGLEYPPLECAIDTCVAVDPNISDSVTEVRFGESYRGTGTNTDGHPRNAVHIQYCREYSTIDDPVIAADIAYCVLQEEPNIQPIRIAAPCEEPRPPRSGHIVVGVGFGRDANGVSGQKQVGRGTLTSTTPFGFNMTTDSWTPGAPLSGDSGGPLFLQLDDGTWRQIGIAHDSTSSYTGIWPRIGWILQDPNIDVGDILPCHDEDGTWNPTPACGSDPLNPDNPSGSWARGPQACFHTWSPLSETCGPNGGAADSGSSGSYLKLDPDAPPPEFALDERGAEGEEIKNPTATTGCSTTGWSDNPMSRPALLFLLFGLTRRRRAEC